MAKVILHTPCDGCDNISYGAFYTLPSGLARQIEVRAYEQYELYLCQPCLDEYLHTDDDGLRQLDMFDMEVE